MLADARLDMTVAPWLVIAPTVGIFLSVGAANLIADGLVRVGGANGSN
jgi:ABC-type dipeptide/oligopeptide/nickel transport system permease subunit